MSYKVNILKKQKARKQYGCLWCRKIIKIGESYYFRRWKGTVYHYHISCVMKVVENGELSSLMEKEG